MARLIDADKLMKAIKSFRWIGVPNTLKLMFDYLRIIIKEQPTIDAVEVVHGRWIPLEYDGYADGNPVWDLWECSECREEHSGDEDTLTPYCPNCGAKMDGERREET